ncbi:SAM50-like protein CG7639 [Chironomus tepperi]|uniref:SAM50-like protein CG7639 n=1 Tax=Chironomus tepperi TaxID=113505 RepID=UPI00391F6744
MGAGKSKESNTKSSASVDFTRFKARVAKININGLDRTKDDYVQRACKKLFSANTFQDVLLETNHAYENLIELGIYKNLKAFIDTDKSPNASQNGYVVSFDGEELTRITGTIGTEIGQNDGALTAELVSPNIFGRGERLSINYSYSYIKATEMNLKFLKPFYHTEFGDYKPETSLTIFRHSNVFPWSRFKSDHSGFVLDFSFLMPLSITHSFQYECGMKEIFASNKQTPFFIRQECGPRLASIFRHIGAFDTRDDRVFPNQGIYVRTTSELIGDKLSNYGAVKCDSHVEMNVPLFAGMSLQLCGRIGKLFENQRVMKPLPIDSLFFLGGPLSLRGFDPAGATPSQEGLPKGSRVYWATGLHLWAPLPFSRYFGDFGDLFRTHFFYNFGNCDTLSLDNLRIAAGVGLAFRIGGRARIEFNYCYPLRKQKNDRVRPAFQFGIGYEFL